jgi:hypothetical protein
MQKRYIYTEDGLEKVTPARRLALWAIKSECETGYDAGCFIDDLDPTNKYEAQDELDNWARDIPTWRIGEFFFN